MKSWLVLVAMEAWHAPLPLAASPLLDVMERNAVTVSFAEDSTLLSEANKGALNTLVGGRDQTFRGSKASVAAWSDRAFPPAGSKLPRRDVELARDRAAAVVAHLRTLSRYHDIQVVNMAKREGVFSRFLATEVAKVKAAFDGDSGAPEWARSEAQMFKTHGAPGRAVVIVYDEAESLAH